MATEVVLQVPSGSMGLLILAIWPPNRFKDHSFNQGTTQDAYTN